jgi:hypothetical protein
MMKTLQRSKNSGWSRRFLQEADKEAARTIAGAFMNAFTARLLFRSAFCAEKTHRGIKARGDALWNPSGRNRFCRTDYHPVPRARLEYKERDKQWQ